MIIIIIIIITRHYSCLSPGGTSAAQWQKFALCVITS